MAERDREDEQRPSPDDAINLENGTTIGAVPGEDDPVNISGFPGGATGWGAWPEGEGTHDDAPASIVDRRSMEEGGSGE